MPYMKYSIADDAYGRLGSSVSTTLTTITLSSSQNLTAGNWIGTLVQYGLDGYPVKKEKVYVTTNSSGVLSVTRGFDGSPAQTFNENDYIFMNVVSEVFEDMQNEISRLETDKANLASPALTGVPTAPTASPGTNTTQLSTTAFVQAAIAALVDSSPGALDTLNELAAALGDDPDFATTITNAIAGKVSKTGNETIAGVKTFSSNAKIDFVKIGGTPILNDADTMQVAFSVDGGFTRHMDFIANGGQNAIVGGTFISFWNNQPGEASATEKMTIHPNGNVGIGTTNPQNKLDINGGLSVGGQNWTSAWTSFYATPTWSGGTTNPTIIDNQSSYKLIGKTLHFKIWIYSSGGDRTGATVLLPFNVASTGRSVFATWSSRDVKPFYAFAFNSQNYINCGSFTQGAGSNELIISGTCEIA